MLAVLDLSLAVSGAAAEANATATAPNRNPLTRSRLRRLLADRALARRRRALELARHTLGALRKEGVLACVVGSLAKGKFRADSDVDYLVENRGGVPESRVTAIVEAAMKGFPFDLTFAGRADTRLLALMREEASRGASVVQPA